MGKTLKLLVIALIAAFSLSSATAEAAAPKKTRHRAKHSSRVASGVPTATTGRKPVAKKKAPAVRARTQASRTTQKPAAKKAPAPAARKPTTKPR
jgi:hypothetical protein